MENWAQFKKGVFLVIVLGIVYNPETKKILIGRRDKDKYVKKLSWSFPGGRPGYKSNLITSLKQEIRKKTGLRVNVQGLLFAKIYPEKHEFLSLYYLCNYIGGKPVAGGKFSELKWVKPAEVKKYFTTSLNPTLFEYLKLLG